MLCLLMQVMYLSMHPQVQQQNAHTWDRLCMFQIEWTKPAFNIEKQDNKFVWCKKSTKQPTFALHIPPNTKKGEENNHLLSQEVYPQAAAKESSTCDQVTNWNKEYKTQTNKSLKMNP